MLEQVSNVALRAEVRRTSVRDVIISISAPLINEQAEARD